MAYEQRSGDISIFRETEKTNERAPDWKGTMIVPEGAKPGDKLDVAMWAKGDRGTMLAGSAKPKDPNFRSGGGSSEVDTGGLARRDTRPLADDADLDIPFLSVGVR